MNVTTELQSIFGNFITLDNGTKVDTAHLRYLGQNNEYIIWELIESTPFNPSDDEYEYVRDYVDICIVTTGNYNPIMQTIKTLMNNNEWLWESNSPEIYDEDTKRFRITLTFMKERCI